MGDIRFNMVEVISVGDINIDMIAFGVEKYPKRDRQIIIPGYHMDVGGCAANFAYAISRLGNPVRFIGKCGNDGFGDFIRKNMGSVELKLRTGTKTGITFATSFTDGSRSFITCPGANNELKMSDISLPDIEGKHLHIASFFLQSLKEHTSELFRFAHKKGMTTSLDTGWDPLGWSKKDISDVRAILKYADIFLPNLKEAEAITGEKGIGNVCRELLSYGVGIVALKKGKYGSFIASEDGLVRIPPYPVADVVDSTGAGDVFDACIVHGHLAGHEMEKTGEFANKTAALSCTGLGRSKYPKPAR